jgi:hypothetical protein
MVPLPCPATEGVDAISAETAHRVKISPARLEEVAGFACIELAIGFSLSSPPGPN